MHILIAVLRFLCVMMHINSHFHYAFPSYHLFFLCFKYIFCALCTLLIGWEVDNYLNFPHQ